MKKFIIVFFLMPSIVFSKLPYKIFSIDMIVNINSNGSLDIQEKVIYDIDDINGIFYNIDTLGIGRLKNLKIYYEDKNSNNFQPALKSTYIKKGNYTIAERNGFYKIKIYIPSKKERKQFIFNYTLTEGVTVYNDIAQINKNILGKTWDESVKYLKFTINLPKKIPANEIYAFAHDSLNSTIEIKNNIQVIYTLKDYYPGENLKANLLFPPQFLDDIDKNKIIKKNMLYKILTYEKNLAQKIILKKEKFKKQIELEKTIFTFGIIYFLYIIIYIYIKNSKKYKVKNMSNSNYFNELPDNYSPAIVGTIMDRKNYPEAKELFATILDLVRRNYLKLSEKNNKIILEFNNKNTSSLKEYEQFLIKWYIEELGDGNKVTLKHISTTVSNKINFKQYNSNFERWQTMVYTEMLYKNLKNDKPNTLSCSIGIISAFIFFIFGVLLSDYFHNNIFLIWTILGIFLFPYIFSRKRYNLKKERTYSNWKKFKKFLSSSKKENENIPLTIKTSNHYFIYAIVLEVTEKFSKKYLKLASTNPYFSVTSEISFIEIYLYNDIFNKLKINTKNIIKNSKYMNNFNNFSSFDY